MNPNRATALFGGKSSGILNWNNIKYPHWYKTYKRLLSNFWKSDEVNMSNDVKEFPMLSTEEQDTFLKVISLLATLDSWQTRLPLFSSWFHLSPPTIATVGGHCLGCGFVTVGSHHGWPALVFHGHAWERDNREQVPCLKRRGGEEGFSPSSLIYFNRIIFLLVDQLSN